jgi:pyruvate dehydrogenase E1 component beta subunit
VTDRRPASGSASVAHLSYREAVRAALRRAMAEDSRVLLMGEDVGRYGGAYAVSRGLLEEFGPERIVDTPLSESGFVGAGIGAAVGGLRPIVEIMTVNFSLLALDQIVNTATTLRHMSGGQVGVPVVIRMATGAGRQLAAQHSHSLEGWYAHVPGLKVLAPSNSQDAYTMLLAALADPDPVIVFEHQTLYPVEGDVDEALPPSDVWRAAVRRPGTQVSLIAHGASVGRALAAADSLHESGIEAEVLDLRALRPLDVAAVAATVKKTHRAVLVDEGWLTGSFAAEVCARIMENAFYDLDAPVARVCSVEVPIPYAKHLEDAALPSAARIVAAAKGLFGSG